MKVKIKQCSWEDVKIITETYDTEYAKFTKRKKPEIWFKALLESNLIGCGCLLILSKTRVRSSNLFVIPKKRGVGVAQVIVNAEEIWAKKHNYKIIDVRTVKSLYKGMGYKELKEYKVGGYWLEKELI